MFLLVWILWIEVWIVGTIWPIRSPSFIFPSLNTVFGIGLQSFDYISVFLRMAIYSIKGPLNTRSHPERKPLSSMRSPSNGWMFCLIFLICSTALFCIGKQPSMNWQLKQCFF